MKIIYLVNARIPTEKAHGYQIMKMCEEFVLQKIDLELWVPTRDNPIRDNAFDYYKIKSRFKIKYLPSFDFLRFVKSLGRWSYYLQVLTFTLKVLISKIPKDAIMYCRNPELVFVLKLKGHEVVYECHDWFATKTKINLFLLKNCNKIITTNNHIKQNFIDNGFRDDRLLTAPNGVNLDVFGIKDTKEDALASLDVNKDIKDRLASNTVLLYTGSYRTMEVGKGIEETLEALKILKNKNLFFVAVGGSDEHIEVYTKFAQQLGVDKQVLFLGRYEQKQLALFQRASDIFLMPFPDKAHYRYHMTPLKMFEYLAGGRPIIASNLPSIKEILNDENCLFCEAGDSGDLAGKIEELLDDGDLANRLSEQARIDIVSFVWEERSNRIIKFINKKND